MKDCNGNVIAVGDVVRHASASKPEVANLSTPFDGLARVLSTDGSTAVLSDLGTVKVEVAGYKRLRNIVRPTVFLPEFLEVVDQPMEYEPGA